MKRAVMYGAGNIGRGFIGYLFSLSGYETTFLDINDVVIDRLNKDRSYDVHIVSNEGEKIVKINNVRGVNSKVVENVVEEILNADVMATAVGVNVLRFIAEPVAKALKARFEANKPELNVILCENLIDADKFFKGEIFKYLSEDDQKLFEKKVGLVEASIGRMVPVLPKNDADPLAVSVEEFDILHLDKNGFKGEIPQIKNLVLCDPFNMYIQRKLFIHNMCHAICAYLGYKKGYGYVSEAISDAEIKYVVRAAGVESARAIAADNGVDAFELVDFLDKLIYRFNNVALKDTVGRVGGDPVRKIKVGDRLVGALKLCETYGLTADWIALGVAALLCYDNQEDAKACEIQESVKNNGYEKTLLDYSGYDFSKERITEILKYVELINKGDISGAIALAEKTKASKIVNK